jgi:hypothetical protein
VSASGGLKPNGGASPIQGSGTRQGDLRDHLRITDDGRRFLDMYDDLRHPPR